jgi:hypothetical protein
MKYLIIILVIFGFGCKKEKLDRNIEIIGYYHDCSIYLSNGSFVQNGGLKANKRMEFKIVGNTEASVSINSVTLGKNGAIDTLNEDFRCVIISNKQTIYDQTGSGHFYRF